MKVKSLHPLRLTLATLLLCAGHILAAAEDGRAVQVSFALLELPTLQTANQSGTPAPQREEIWLHPDPLRPEVRLPLKSLAGTRPIRTLLRETPHRFAYSVDGSALKPLPVAFPSEGDHFLVLLSARQDRLEHRLLPFPHNASADTVLVMNITESPHAVSIGEEPVVVPPKDFRSLQHEGLTQAPLKIAVKSRDNGNWRLSYSSSLSPVADQATVVAICPGGRTNRVVRLSIPLR